MTTRTTPTPSTDLAPPSRTPRIVLERLAAHRTELLEQVRKSSGAP